MGSFFRGRYDGKIDDKGRIFLPSGIKSSLSPKEKKIVITNGYSQGFKYLDAFSLSAWKQLEQKISKLSSLRSEVQAFQRFYMSGGQIIEIDTNQRILVPTELRTYSQLQGNLIFVGMGEKFEIWSKDQWEKLYGQLTQNFDQTLLEISNEDKK